MLRDAALSYGVYLEQLRVLLFPKLAHEQTQPPRNQDSPVPEGYDWGTRVGKDGVELDSQYRWILEHFGKQHGLHGLVFRKAQNKIQDPAKLKRLISDLLDKERWMILSADIKGDAYEGWLERNARATKSGAGSYFTNPPFGRQSSIKVNGEEGDVGREAITDERDDFWATTSNKQLNVLQHIKSLLTINGRAAVVIPDNVLFEGSTGEVIRFKLLHECDVHPMLRLATGIFYAQGVEVNVLFVDRRAGRSQASAKQLWVYDLPTNKHFTLKTNPLQRADLDEFVGL